MEKRTILYRLLLFLQVFVILSFSMMNGEASGQTSGVLSTWLYHLLHIPFSDDLFHLLIRKAAHFTEYAVLGGLIFLNEKQAPLFGIKRLTYVFFLVPLFDEFLQTKVPGRAGMFTDCLIDLSGCLSAVLILHLLTKKKSRV